VSGEQIAGYYDPKRKRLAVVSGGASSNGVIAEIILAHELNHALEDQAHGIDDDPATGTDDRQSADTALVEGTATVVMEDYIERFVPPAAALTGALSAAGPAAAATEKIPPYIQDSLEWSYTGGADFVRELRRVGDGWKLVNRALGEKPPASTEQILHPQKYVDFEPPVRVRIGELGLGDGWKRSSRGTIGEYDTRALLELGVEGVRAADGATGWGGGSYEAWRNEAAADGCDEDPCRAANVLVVRWAWDNPTEARQFEAVLPQYLINGLDAKIAGPLRWSVDGGGAAVVVDSRTTTLAFAPTPAEAARVATSAGGERRRAAPRRAEQREQPDRDRQRNGVREGDPEQGGRAPCDPTGQTDCG
jgi:hypothetical protein